MMSAGEVAVTNLRTFSMRRIFGNGEQQQQQPQQQQQQQPRCINRSVCRNLFGTVDRDANRRFVEEQLGRLRLEQNRRWNFDFENETPLPGRYEWEPTTTPPPSSEVHDLQMDDGEAAAKEEEEENYCGRNDFRLSVGRQRQTTMTAYFPQRKRLAADGGERTHIEGSSKLMDTPSHVTSSSAGAAAASLSIVTAGVVSKKAKQ